jgi:hypothetical protein
MGDILSTASKAVLGTASKAALGAAPAIIGGVVQAGLGLYQYQQGRKDANAARAEIAQLRANAPSLATPAAFTDFYKNSMDRSNLDFANQQIARRTSTNVAALAKAGGRALVGGLGATTDQASQAQFKARMAQQQREMQGSMLLGGAQQKSQALREGRFQTDLGMADAARQSAIAAQQAGIKAISGGVMGAAGAYGSAFGQASQQANDLAIASLGKL